METKKVDFKIHIKKGDTVMVIAGDEKGKFGTVLFVDTKKYRALVEGLNMMTKHSKPSAASPEGGILKMEGSMHISNLMLLDPKSGKPTRIGRKKIAGKTVRISKKSGQSI